MGIILPHGFKNTHDINIASFIIPGQNSSPIYENTGDIHATHGHNTTGHVFIAPTNRHNGIVAHPFCHNFNTISYDLARNERIFHAFVTHPNTIAHGNGMINLAHPTRSSNPFLNFNGQIINMNIARSHFATRTGNANNRLLKIFICKAYST
ncbi:MAG: hypothetical protein ACD_73C00065G0001 [uncultured bacterium]|nr:MAG: hypothetical protein ACD_73C00065G0001 [uncultured bacterium]